MCEALFPGLAKHRKEGRKLTDGMKPLGEEGRAGTAVCAVYQTAEGSLKPELAP